MGSAARKIQNKISATKKTSQITKAMNMVSASSLRNAQKRIGEYSYFNERLEKLLINLASSQLDEPNPLLVPREVNNVCYILVSSERGLAGPFNNNVFKMLSNIAINDNFKVVPLGTRAISFCNKMKYDFIDKDYHVQLRDDIAFSDVAPLITRIIKAYLKKEIDSVVIIYNHFVNTLNITPTYKQVLPLSIDKSTDVVNDIYEYLGGSEDILSSVLALYIENLIYGIILDSKISEHASRMTAMKNATDNAAEIIEKLQIKYNHARQGAITSDLIDIIGGASALSKK